MAILRYCSKLLALSFLVWQFAANGWAQNYPAKVVRYLVPDSPGSMGDNLGRIVTAGLAEIFGNREVGKDHSENGSDRELTQA